MATIAVPGDFATIQAAVNAAAAGDEIIVANGVYNESVNVGSAPGDITIRAENAGMATVNGGGASAFFTTSHTGEITIDGFVLQSSSTDGTQNGVINFINVNGRIRISNNRFANTAGQIFTDGIFVQTTVSGIPTSVSILNNSFGDFDNDQLINIEAGENNTSNADVDILIEGNSNDGVLEDNGIRIDLESSNSITFATIRNNNFSGFTGAGSAINFRIAGDTPQPVNPEVRFLIENNVISGVDGDGIFVNLDGTDSRMFGVINNNTINGGSDTEHGIYIDDESSGRSIDATIFVTNNTVASTKQSGIRYRPFNDTAGDPHQINLVIDGNDIDNPNSDNSLPTGAGETPPELAGIDLSDDSAIDDEKYVLNAEIINNNITVTASNATCILLEEPTTMVAGTAVVDVLLSGNVLNGCTVPIIRGGVNTSVTDPVPGSASLFSIGDRIWNDLNENGIQDAGEPGIPAVEVSFSGNGVSGATTSDSNGEYFIPSLSPGTYTLTVNPPAGFPFITTANQGGDDDLDSDFDPNTGQFSVTLTAGGSNVTNADAGLSMNAPQACMVTINSVVPTAEVCPGANDGMITVAATCTGCTGTLEYSIFPDPNTGSPQGSNVFMNLPDGTYTVTVTDGGNTGCNAMQADVVVAAGAETQAPTAVCNDITIELDANGQYSLTTADLEAIAAGSMDNCSGFGDLTFTSSQTDFDCDDVSLPAGMPNTLALDFDGVNDRASTNQALPELNNFTLEYYVFPRAGNGNFDRITGTRNNVEFETAVGPTGNLHYWFLDEPGWNFTDVFIPLNTWTQVTWVKDGADFRLYINGVHSYTANVVANVDAIIWSIGGNFSGNQSTNSILDEVRIWDVPRTAGEIAANYDKTLSGVEPGLLAYYTMEDGSGSMVLSDVTGNGYDAALTDMEVNSDWVTPGSPAMMMNGAGGATIVMTVTDESGNQANCNASIVVLDNTPPTFACPADMDVDLNANCEFVVPDLISGLIATDNCNVTFEQTPTANTVAANFNDGDSQVVTIVATDQGGNTNTTACLVTLTANNPGTVAISDAIVEEFDSGTTTYVITVTLTNPGCAFSVDYATADNGAAAGADYVATSGTLNFSAGQISQTVSVTVNGDTDVEPDEQFFINLSNATNGVAIADGQGIVTITNDDLLLCPTIGGLDGPATVCRDEIQTISATGLTLMEEAENAEQDFGIRFVYFSVATADPYTGGTELGTVATAELEDGGATANLEAAFPDAAGEIFVYAVLSPAPNDPTCRPSEELSVNVYSCGITNDDDTNPTISDPCSCKDNATTLIDGQFDELVQVFDAPAGQTWTVVAIDGLFQSSSPAPPMAPLQIGLGTMLTEVPTATPGVSDYELTGVHVDGVGYSIMVSNGTTTLAISNRCWYPNPSFDNLAASYCRSNGPVTLMGSAQLGDDSGEASPESEMFMVINVETGATVVNAAEGSAILDVANLPAGRYRVIFTFNGADDDPDQSHPGCTQSIEQVFEILEVNCGTFPWGGD